MSLVAQERPHGYPAQRRIRLDAWTLVTIAVAGLLAIPVLVVFSAIFRPAGDLWAHIVDTVLWRYIVNTLLLSGGVGIGTFIIGVGTAWLVTMCRFPGRRIFEWALFLPMAVPAYVLAYTYTGMLDFSGPVQSGLRALFGWSQGEYWFFDVRSLEGAIIMLSLVLYPYVYLLSRTAFLEQSAGILEISRTLGCRPARAFFTVALPMARPAIVAGLALALMETVGDFGTVDYFAVDTFTTGIFRTWFNLGAPGAAMHLAAILTGFVFILIVAERLSRRGVQFFQISGRYKPLPVFRLSGGRAVLAFAACSTPIFLGFFLPGAFLSFWAVESIGSPLLRDFDALALNTVMVASLAAVLAVAISLLIAYALRLGRGGRWLRASARTAAMGYAIPGTVVAVGVLALFAWSDERMNAWMEATLGLAPGLLLSGSVAALVFAYLVRFMAISLNAMEAGLGRITPSMDDAARTLGEGPLGTLGRIHMPLMSGTILTAALLVFVDVMKELPATLILRPFNFNTFAVKAYELASDEQLAIAAAPAVSIVLTGIIPVILLSRAISRARPDTPPEAVS